MLLDKNKTENYVYLNLKELSEGSTFTMSVTSLLTYKSASTSLANDLSEYPERYSKYLIDNSFIEGLEEGSYIYQVKENGEELLTGTVSIIDTSEPYTTISAPDDTGNFLVYNNDENGES